MSEGPEPFPDVRALLAAKRLAVLLTQAALVDGPAQTQVVRALCTRSAVVLTWAQWERRVAFLLPVGLSLNAAAIGDILAQTHSWWATPASTAGTASLCVAVVGLWRANQHALKLAVGTYLDVAPRQGLHGDEAG